MEIKITKYTKDLIDREKLDKNMLGYAVTYFDQKVDRLLTKFQQDIEENEYSKKVVWQMGFQYLSKHGHGITDYREYFIDKSADVIMESRKVHPLLIIGEFFVRFCARNHAHYTFYEQAKSKAKFNEIIASLEELPQYEHNREQLIKDLCKNYPDIPYNTWRSRVQRRRKKKEPKKGANT